MQKFSTIQKRAEERKGGKAILASLMPAVITDKQLLAISDDRFLSEMSRCLFQAGFVWRVVNQKWDSFEQVFFKFDPNKLVLLSPEQLENLAKNPAIIRNMQKIVSVQKNAQMVLDIAHEYGSVSQFIASWPKDDHIGLFKNLKQHGDRLGGNTGPRVLRNLGIDTFVLSPDVVMCLQQAGADIRDNPSSQKDFKLIQQVFNTWHTESGLPYSHISRMCACSVGTNNPVE